MEHKKYLIIGGGFAGFLTAYQLIKKNIDFILFSENFSSASHISAGIVNPVILKKFTLIDNADLLLTTARETLSDIENKINGQFIVNQPIERIFHNEEEKKTWLKKSENHLSLKKYLDLDFTQSKNLPNPFGMGKISNSFRINVPIFFEQFHSFLQKREQIAKENFDFNSLDLNQKKYKNYDFTNIIFCEGIKIKNNPFFNHLPIGVNKGHHLLVEKNDFLVEKTFKKRHFLFPYHHHLYYYGGTYQRDNLEDTLDFKAKEELENALTEILPHFEIKNIFWGFRPTTQDRKPILGSHPEHNNLFIFNGLGSRGIFHSCYYSKILIDFIEENIPLPPEVDLKRFF